MRKTLTIFITVILLAFSFTFSSCKNCNGNKGKDGGKDNPDNPYNPAADGDKSIPDIDDSALTEVGRCLKGKGASPQEIIEMMNIEKEDFGENIGRVIFNGTNHYYYRDDRRDHHGQSGAANCGLYAMKRLLFVLGRHKIVDEDLWCRHTDDQLREMIFELLGGELASESLRIIKEHTEMISAGYLRTLMKNIGIPPERCLIYYENDEIIPNIHASFCPDVLSREEYAISMAETKGKIIEIKSRAQELLVRAKATKDKIQLKVNEANNEHEGDKRQQALQEARQALAELVNLVENELEKVSDDENRCRAVNGRNVFVPIAEEHMLRSEQGAIARVFINVYDVLREARNIKIPDR
jgi:hypothetical protein